MIRPMTEYCQIGPGSRNSLRLLVLGFLFLMRVAHGDTPGSLDSGFSFTPPTPETGTYPRVNAIAHANVNQIIVVSSYVSEEGYRDHHVNRVNGDGSIDQAFAGSSITYENGDSSVSSIAVDQDGKIVIAGSFTHVDGVPCPSIARLNTNGSLDPSFDPGSGPDSDVFDLSLDADGGIILVGWFASVDGQSRNNIARLLPSGAVDTAFAPEVNDLVRTVCRDSAGRILIGGWFTEVEGNTRNRIARLLPDGTVDETFDPAIDPQASVLDVAVDHMDRVVIASSFMGFGGLEGGDVVRLHRNGNVDTGFDGPEFDDPVTDLAIDTSGRVLVGGDFTTIDGAAIPYLTRLNRDGSRDVTFDYGGYPLGQVGDLLIDIGGRLLVGSAVSYEDGWFGSRLDRFHGGESDSVPGINITFDYRYDTGGFFAGDNIGRRLVLEEAARVYESRLLDRLDPIDPVDSDPGVVEGWRAEFTDPGTGDPAVIEDMHVPANTLIVFPGASDGAFDPEDLAKASSKFSIENTTFSRNDVISRGGGEASGSLAVDYSGWGGSIRFRSAVDWFDSPPPGSVDSGKTDLYSTALHELAHLLGIAVGTPSWENRMVAYDAEKVRYTGSRGLAVQGSQNLVFVELVDDEGQTRIGSHFWPDTLSKVVGTGVVQESALTDTLAPGFRRFLTELDLAALDDIGWDVAWPNPINRAAIQKKISAVQAAIKKAKKSGNSAKVRVLTKQLRNLKRQLL